MPEEVLGLVGRAAEEVDARWRPLHAPGSMPSSDWFGSWGGITSAKIAVEHQERQQDEQPDDGGALAEDVAQGVAPEARAARRGDELVRLDAAVAERRARSGRVLIAAATRGSRNA